jgi:hypothetical protein
MKLSTLLEGLGEFSRGAGPKGRWYTKGSYDDPEVKALMAAQRKKLAAAEKRAQANADKPPKAIKLNLDEVWRKAEDAAGSSFPDGDPIDHLIPWFKSKGVKYDIMSYLDAAVKKHTHCKTWYEYLADMWDTYQNEGVDQDSKKYKANPWK